MAEKKPKKPYYNLKALRAKRGASQEKMAGVLGMSKMSYNRKENGIGDFTIAEAKAIATYFKSDPNSIFFAD